MLQLLKPVSFYGETDQEHADSYLEELDLEYRVHYLSFGYSEGQISLNYNVRGKGSTELQKALLAKIEYLAKGDITLPVQSLMESLGVHNPVTILCVLDNLAKQGLIVNFEWPN